MVALLSIILLISCSADSGNTTGGETNGTTPSKLVVSATLVGANAQNPSGDGSGKVNFNISATNATSYKIAFGDGNLQNATSGMNTHIYSTVGTFNYLVNITAYNGTNFVSTSVTITLYVAPTSIWSDEFNIDGAPNPTKWGYDLGGGGWGNNESQYYTNRSDNVIVANGVLKIIAKKENYQGSSYTSARLLTKGKFSFKYGKVEVRAKLPAGGGTWPAIWALGANIDTNTWPACGEIDIMEHVGNQLNKIHGTLHYPGHFGGNGDTSSVIISNVASEFHIYSIDWRADAIKFYVDSQLFKTFVNSAGLPFNQNFFLIFNIAMGGSFGGAINPAFTQSSMEIDYIRVYN